MEGILYGGSADLLIEQIIANGVTIVYSFLVTAGIMLALKATIGVRVSDEVEYNGLDQTEHAENAYHGGAATMERV
jgi:Amt family ammonium transporter